MGGREFGDFLVFANLSKIGGLGEGVYKVGVGVHACFFVSFDERVKDGAGLGPLGGVGKEKVLPANHKRFYAVFGTVVR